ncbi:MAG: hypothetical protein KA791_15205, partial [Flavobacteriales bacterium]|nr:hypothetical protein [Flavobacteriales bacterium]
MKPTLLLTAILLTATSVAQTAGWTALTPMATARKGAVSFSIGTKGYICTGEDASGNKLKDLWEFNASTLPGTQVWTQRASLDAVVPARSGAAGFAVQGNGYMGTGEDANGNRLSDFYKFDPIANSWSTIQALPGLGRSEGVGFAVGDKGYAGLGKFDNAGTIPNTDFYELNPITGNWSVRAQFPVPGPRIGAVGFGIGFYG